MPYGVVNAPGQRYHPAIVAQAAATLAELFPGRLSVALGTGEFSNEHITGEPVAGQADAQRPAARVRRRDPGAVRGRGRRSRRAGHASTARSCGPCRPSRRRCSATAVSAETAGLAGEWADGLITINQPREQLERVLAAFREHGGEGKPVAVQAHLSWAATEDEALRIAHDQWRTNVFAPPLCWDLATVEQFDVAATHVRPEDVREAVLVSSDLARHVAWIQELVGARARRRLPAPRRAASSGGSSTPSASTSCPAL